jgi:glutamate dehydrogenase/leucine dehydrogenase
LVSRITSGRAAGIQISQQGFGAVGRHAARFLASKGAILVAASDSKGAIADRYGLDIDRLTGLKAHGKSVADYSGGEQLKVENLISVDCHLISAHIRSRDVLPRIPYCRSKGADMPLLLVERHQRISENRRFSATVGEPGAMAWVKDETGRAVGLPRELGGIPLDEIGATGFGLAVAAEVAQEFSKVQLEGARVVVLNIAVTTKAEQRMHERGILSIPDFIANAGGVIAAAVEYRGGTEKAAFEAIAEKVAANTRSVLEVAAAKRVPPRLAAIELARNRVEKAMSLRRCQA